ncbi:HAD family hydrolase [Candidatus Woesearchaeota archaeon]|nr:HAD family hydrolase [Candidatus Woesearchaeota archaeon]
MGFARAEAEGKVIIIITGYILPGKQGLLDKPVKVPNTNIEIIRPFDGSKLKAVLFDLDGTLSLERDGWINLMIKVFVDELVKAGVKEKEALMWSIKYIQDTIGITTYVQMQALADEIKQRGGMPKHAWKYKQDYNKELVELVEKQRKELPKDKLRVAGILELLKLLAARFGKNSLYIGSASDIDAVLSSVSFLGYDDFFDKNNIVGAGSVNDPKADSKKLVIDKLMNEQGLKLGELLCFGNGFPEILHTYNAGGICIGVLTPDESKYKDYFTVEQRREILINAGAHIVMPDYTCSSELVKLLLAGKQPQR